MASSNHEIEGGTDTKVDAVKGVNTGSDASGRLSAQYMDSIFSKNNDDIANKAGDTKQSGAFAGELHPLSVENTAGAKPSVERTAAVQDQSQSPKPADLLPPLQVTPDLAPQPQQKPLEVTPAPQGPQPDGAVLAPGVVHVGAHDYQIALGPDGQTNTLNFASPDGASALQLTRDASGNLMVASATGDFQPKNGVITFEGIPLFVGPDGKVSGDISFDSKGDVKYKTAKGPDQKEYDRMANGTIKMTDFKNWEQTTITADGHAITNYWDGYEWREGQPSPDGKRIDFMPQDPTKPASISRDTSGGQNLTQIAWADGTNYNCDWNKQMIVEQIPPGSDGTPAQTVNLYYNGSTFQPAQQVTPDKPNPGDTSVVFQDAQAGDPASAVLHADGGVTSTYADNTIVDKDPDGYVKSISGPKGNWLFMEDVNGDVEKFQHTYAGQDGKPQTDTYTRNSAEQNPGMNYWFSRFGNNVPRPPDVLPPSDPNNPSGYDTYVDEHGNVVSMNLNVTADGTVRISQKGQDGKPAISYQAPVDAPPPQQQQQQDAPPPAPQDNTPQPGPQQDNSTPRTTDSTNS